WLFESPSVAPRGIVPSSIRVMSGGILKRCQCFQGFGTASISSKIRTRLLASLGTSIIVKGGLILGPRQVYLMGISPLFTNALLISIDEFIFWKRQVTSI